MAVIKNIHYLLRPYSMPEAEFEKLKKTYTERGSRVIVLAEGQRSIHEGLQTILMNHSI